MSQYASIDRVLMLLTATLLISCSESSDKQENSDNIAAPNADFNYITVRGGRLRTLHDIKYEVAATDEFEITESNSRVEEFNGTPYNISLAAFISDDSALMIHAETVADSSGASDYSNLPQAKWPDDTFRSSGHACFELPADEVDGEHDLEWLRDNGFEPAGTLLFAQYFSTTADNNVEVVFSLMQHVPSCDDESSNLSSIKEFQAKIRVTKIE